MTRAHTSPSANVASRVSDVPWRTASRTIGTHGAMALSSCAVGVTPYRFVEHFRRSFGGV